MNPKPPSKSRYMIHKLCINSTANVCYDFIRMIRDLGENQFNVFAFLTQTVGVRLLLLS